MRTSALAVLGALGCAAGAEGESDNFGFHPMSPSATSGDESDGESSSTGAPLPKEDEGPDPGDSSGPMMTTAVADTGDESSSGATLDGDSDDDGSTTSMCQNETICAQAVAFGGVAGDVGSPQIMTMGDEPVWVAFEVAENNDDIIGETLSFTATLVSPAGLDFDLFVYRGPSGGSSGCGGTMQSSTNSGGNDVVSMTWGEGALANNADDDAWIAVEIVAKNGMCMAGANWTLTVQGDT